MCPCLKRKKQLWNTHLCFYFTTLARTLTIDWKTALKIIWDLKTFLSKSYGVIFLLTVNEGPVLRTTYSLSYATTFNLGNFSWRCFLLHFWDMLVDCLITSAQFSSTVLTERTCFWNSATWSQCLAVFIIWLLFILRVENHNVCIHFEFTKTNLFIFFHFENRISNLFRILLIYIKYVCITFLKQSWHVSVWGSKEKGTCRMHFLLIRFSVAQQNTWTF